MKTVVVVLIFQMLSIVVFAQHEHQQTEDSTSIKNKVKSPRLTAMAIIGNNHVHIDYGSPSVRGRSIWNGLVAYKQVWATGAHKATWIEFSQDVLIGGKRVTKGKYGFFTIPDKKQWVLIFSNTWDMHLADEYTIEKDVARLNVKPKKNKKMVESLTYEVLDRGKNKGEVKMSWDFLNVSFFFENI